jgi:cytidine deaminase
MKPGFDDTGIRPFAREGLTPMRKRELIEAAKAVRENSYSPYSKYKVGAALLAVSGKIYSGANFENAAYGAGTCAERVALGAALSAGERKFKAICVCGADASITPCGICRQALVEFGDIDVICVGEDGGETSSYRLSELLKASFGPANLG